MKKKIKIVSVVGTRPEIIRLSRVFSVLDKYCEHILIHTGQNYDYELNQIFFNDLKIRKPNFFLNSSKNSKSAANTIGNLITAVDENIDQTQCGGSMNCLKDKPCTSHHVWTGLNKIIKNYMESITIEDVITNQVMHDLHDAREIKTHVS